MSKPKRVELKDGRVVYRIVYDAGRDPETGKRKQITRTFNRKRDAENELARVRHQRASGTYVAPSSMTVAQVIDEYLASAAFERQEGTKSNYAYALKVPRERLGDRRAQSITRQDIEDLRDFMLTRGRKRGGTPGTALGPRSVRLALGRLSAAFEQACEDGKLPRNPCQRVTLPKLVKGEHTTWSEDEVRQVLAAAAADRLHAAWLMTLYGARRGEVLGVKWDSVDIEAKTVRLGPTRVLVDGQIIEKDSPKSENGWRTLPLDDILVAALKTLRKRQAAEALAAGPAYSRTGYVVADELGAPVHPEWYSDEFARLAKRAGVPAIRLHDGRHTVNSLMARAGVPDHIRAAWCGHTVAVNVSTYTHARPEDMTLARDALSQIFGHGAVT